MKTIKIIAFATALLLAASLAWITASWRSKAQIQFALEHERHRCQTLMTEKLAIEELVEQTTKSLREAEDSIAKLSRQIERLTSTPVNGIEEHPAFFQVSQQLYRAKDHQGRLKQLLSTAYLEKQNLSDQNERLLDSLRYAQVKNGEWIKILKMEIIGLHE